MSALQIVPCVTAWRLDFNFSGQNTTEEGEIGGCRTLHYRKKKFGKYRYTAKKKKIGNYRNVIVKAYVVGNFVVLRAKNEAKTMIRL